MEITGLNEVFAMDADISWHCTGTACGGKCVLEW